MTHPATGEIAPGPMTACGADSLTGDVTVPGDKSISIRSLLFGALAIGETHVTGLLESEDALDTAECLKAMGAQIEKSGEQWRVRGCGVGGLGSPARELYFGNSGTGARLVMGAVAGNPVRATFTGDASLSKRPMARVLTPLKQMGLAVEPEDAVRLPLTLIGTQDLLPITYRLPVASAQVKSAVLIAGLHADGVTTVIEPTPTRDHTENMLRHFGVDLDIAPLDGEAGRSISVRGLQEMRGTTVVVPADPSSAAFLVVAALLVPGSDLTIRNVLVNETRVGLYTTLVEMGADLTFLNRRLEAGEPVADLQVRASRLNGVHVPAARAPSMIDEYPVLSVAAAMADGITVMEGLGELTVKESDRLAATAAGLAANGVVAEVEGETLRVTGSAGKAVPGGGMVETHLDHRIAMAFLIMGLVSQKPVAVSDAAPIATSFPVFRSLLTSLGARLRDGDAR